MQLTESLPITPVYEGESPQFMQRMAAFVNALPDIFQRVRSLRLEKSYRALHKLRFVEQMERGANVISFYDPSNDSISVYPMAFPIGGRVDLALYSGFGLRYWHLAVNSAARVTWARLLIKPDRAVVDRLSHELESGQHHAYHDVLSVFKDAVERLQVIHVLNALIHNNVSVQRAQTTSIYDYPPTRDFCASLRPYSLAPLLSAYSGVADLRQYQYAFAQFCVRNGRLPVSEISTEASLVELFELVTFHADQIR